MTEREIQEGVSRRKWFHRIELPYGIITPGVRGVELWEKYKLPSRVDGMRILDIGAWDGAFSFEAVRRGAKEVVALDVWGQDNPGSLGLGLSNLEFAQAALGTHVKIHEGNVYSVDASLGCFDLVLFLQVLYHLQDPMLALNHLRGITRKLVCLETWMDACWINEAAAVFYPGAELNNDPTNWWGPNEACVHGMAKACGFQSALVWSEPDSTHFGGRGKRACFHLT